MELQYVYGAEQVVSTLRIENCIAIDTDHFIFESTANIFLPTLITTMPNDIYKPTMYAVRTANLAALTLHQELSLILNKYVRMHVALTT